VCGRALLLPGAQQEVELFLDFLGGDRPVLCFGHGDEVVDVVALDLAGNRCVHVGGQA
jgi:hypothetical protein